MKTVIGKRFRQIALASAVALCLGSTALAAQQLTPQTREAKSGQGHAGNFIGGGGPIGAPEVDPALAVAASVLVTGGALVLLGRRRPKTA
jgi:hypothetical protein